MHRVILTALAACAVATGASAQAHDTHGSSSSGKPWSQADAYFDPVEMDAARAHVQAHSGDSPFAMVRFDRLEAQSSDGETVGVWDADAWYGGDINKIWFKTEGRSSLNKGDVEDAEIQALYSRAVAPYWNLQTGIRHDFKPDSLDHAVIGIQGLAPYFFEVDMSAYLSTEGDVTARAELEYELLLTQRLILQPRIEANVSAQDIPDRQIGAGLNNINAGLRLRYEIKRQFAPYIGVEWQGNFGGTKNIIEATGGEAYRTVVLAGVRTWF